ncbi:hypothetical protein CBR_g54796 [Chara braunii]|uniref:Uncharacterized protein n=1 Tax=Chara braunii TaxID=69332 RepID=A0A388JPE5_CHABU|nr:hypothetical protein CBR_g54796 [Chara braunii]|eukprot:GBG59690.1 hypothetical protein CBR_g54796 [Chara braunii]
MHHQHCLHHYQQEEVDRAMLLRRAYTPSALALPLPARGDVPPSTATGAYRNILICRGKSWRILLSKICSVFKFTNPA